MKYETLGKLYLHELELEVPASRKCLERIPENLFTWKPHERSLEMGYLALMVAEIPKWINEVLVTSTIDYGTFKHIQPKVTADLVNHLDENIAELRKVLEKITDEELSELFYLKVNGKTLFSIPKVESVSSTLNHWVHHRGQLTVYMRLNNIAVPSIYGPSADEKTF